MKHLLNIILLYSVTANLTAQNDLKFDKRFVQCEDHWVAFPADSIGNHVFGFIYIDAQAGLTLDFTGSFRIDRYGEFITEEKERESSVKVRLQPNTKLVSFIADSKLEQLHVDKIPEWLKFYKEDENSIKRLYRWGYMYNGWNECKKALEFLEKAKGIDSGYRGLRVELAYSYNCLKRYQDAIDVLKEALESDPTDAYTNKELIYAQSKTGQLQNAENSFKKALDLCPDKTYNAENAYNILQQYYLEKDIEKFNLWLGKTSSLLSGDKRFNPLVEKMKADLK